MGLARGVPWAKAPAALVGTVPERQAIQPCGKIGMGSRLGQCDTLCCISGLNGGRVGAGWQAGRKTARGVSFHGAPSRVGPR